MMHFFRNATTGPLAEDYDGDRGRKRRLELKKFKLLGQVQVLKQVL